MDINDLTIVLAHYGQSIGDSASAGLSAVPEPGILALSAAGLASLLVYASRKRPVTVAVARHRATAPRRQRVDLLKWSMLVVRTELPFFERGSTMTIESVFRKAPSAVSAGVYLGRAFGRDHDRRHPGRAAAAAGSTGGSRGAPAVAVHQQPEGNRLTENNFEVAQNVAGRSSGADLGKRLLGVLPISINRSAIVRPMAVRTVGLVSAGLALTAVLSIAVRLPAANADEHKSPTPPEMRPVAKATEGTETTNFSDGRLRLVIGERLGASGQKEYWVHEVALRVSDGWQPILSGVDGKEFSTSLGDANATHREQVKNDATGVVLRMSCQQEAWEAEEMIEMVPSTGILKRKQTYRFLKPCEGSVHPGFRVKAQSDVRYTYPMWIHEQPLAGAKPMSRPVDWADGGEAGVLRQPVDWAVPLPLHIWHDRRYVALYGLDKSVSPGTLDFTPAGADGLARLRVYYPDSFPEAIPGTTKFAAGHRLTLTEVIAAKPLAAGDDPLLEAERMAASILLRTPPHPADLKAVARASRITSSIADCGSPTPLDRGAGGSTTCGCTPRQGTARKTGVNAGLFDSRVGRGRSRLLLVGRRQPIGNALATRACCRTWTR